MRKSTKVVALDIHKDSITEWSDVEDALREGEPPKPDEILTDVQTQEKQDRAINILL